MGDDGTTALPGRNDRGKTSDRVLPANRWGAMTVAMRVGRSSCGEPWQSLATLNVEMGVFLALRDEYCVGSCAEGEEHQIPAAKMSGRGNEQRLAMATVCQGGGSKHLARRVVDVLQEIRGANVEEGQVTSIKNSREIGSKSGQALGVQVSQVYRRDVAECFANGDMRSGGEVERRPGRMLPELGHATIEPAGGVEVALVIQRRSGALVKAPERTHPGDDGTSRHCGFGVPAGWEWHRG